MGISRHQMHTVVPFIKHYILISCGGIQVYKTVDWYLNAVCSCFALNMSELILSPSNNTAQTPVKYLINWKSMQKRLGPLVDPGVGDVVKSLMIESMLAAGRLQNFWPGAHWVANAERWNFQICAENLFVVDYAAERVVKEVTEFAEYSQDPSQYKERLTQVWGFPC